MRVKVDSLVVVLNGALILAQFLFRNPTVVIGSGDIRIKPDGLVVVFNGALILA